MATKQEESSDGILQSEASHPNELVSTENEKLPANDHTSTVNFGSEEVSKDIAVKANERSDCQLQEVLDNTSGKQYRDNDDLFKRDESSVDQTSLSKNGQVNMKDHQVDTVNEVNSGNLSSSPDVTDSEVSGQFYASQQQQQQHAATLTDCNKVVTDNEVNSRFDSVITPNPPITEDDEEDGSGSGTEV